MFQVIGTIIFGAVIGVGLHESFYQASSGTE